jgi:uncharacterized protein
MKMWQSGRIIPPPRQSFASSAIVVLVVAVISVAFVWPKTNGLYTLVALAMFLTVAMIKRYLFVIHIALLALLLLLLVQFGGPFRFWPFNILIPLILYAIIVGVIPALRNTINWHKRGEMSAMVTLMVVATIVLSAAALVGWMIIMKPDIGHHLAQMPELPFWVYPFAGAGFAILNALMEEVIFRGIMMEALDSAMGPGHCAIGIQAISFAALHYLAGFPNGVAGFMMVFIYGAMLGAIRRVSKGLLAPLVAHVAADLVIFSILLYHFFSR